ncbi:MAG: chromosome partitioning protein ParA, partial [Planctomyces sp.]|nr:chromosome partitioning protein ParA [Planctomyces sp.]
MRHGRGIALMNQKGGVGKTTTAVNLAAGIARLGRSTLLIDLDPQAHATLHLGVEAGARGGSPGAYELLLDPSIGVGAASVEARERLRLVPAQTDLAAIESELVSAPDRLTRLRAALAAVPEPERAEFVIIDCPPSLGTLTLNALAAVREVMVPMQAQFLALQGLGKLMETVSIVGRGANPQLHVTGVILCNHDAGTTHAREVVADLDAFFEQARSTDRPWRAARVYRPGVRRNVKLAEAPSFGRTIYEYAPGCPGAADYEALARAIVAEWDALRAAQGVVLPGRGVMERASAAGAA